MRTLNLNLSTTQFLNEIRSSRLVAGPDILMQQYELLSIVPTQFTDEEVGEISKQISALVEKVGGNVVSTTNLGKIRMAYPIKKIRHGKSG
jgi:hypothetical protein